MLVDVQNTFCIPGSELYVAGRSGNGAVDDNRRLCEFVYRNLGAITQIVPTMDTHRVMQIFHPIWLRRRRRQPPGAVHADHRAGRRERPLARQPGGRGERPGRGGLRAASSCSTTRGTLEAGGKYSLTIWPYHAMLGGIGHALVSSVEEAVFFHAVARYAQPDFQVKGENPLTEHYSILAPEVKEGPDGELIASENDALIERLLSFDAVVVAGQAKSHCVAWTIDDLLAGDDERERALAPRTYLLEDCTSPVVVPGVDYTDEAAAAFRRFAEAGMHVVRSTEPMESWPEPRRGASGDELEPRVGPVAAADLGRRAPVGHHDVAGEVVLPADQRRADPVRVDRARRAPRSAGSSRP